MAVFSTQHCFLYNNSFSVILSQYKDDDDERLCAMEPLLQFKRILITASFEPRPLAGHATS